MRKTVGTLCLTIVVALVVFAISSPGYAQVEVRIKVDRDPIVIDMDEKGRRFVGLCKNPNKCDSNTFKWTLKGNNQLEADEELWILSAPGHLECFESTLGVQGLVAKFTTTNQGDPQFSGDPNPACSLDKYGTYWPYVIVLYKVDPVNHERTLLATTDPGAVIFP